MKRNSFSIVVAMCLLCSLMGGLLPFSVYAAAGSITYHSNGGTGGPSRVDFTSAPTGSYSLNNNVADSPVYAVVDDTQVCFIGWTAAPTTEIYARNDTRPPLITTVKILGHVTVYAAWGFDANNNSTADILEKKTVLFQDSDGSLISEQSYGYLSSLWPPIDRSSTADRNEYAAFVGWSPALADQVVKDATYTAQYARGSFDPSNTASDLQNQIDQTSAGGTLTLETGKTYQGDITIDKAITITSVEFALIDGKISISDTLSRNAASSAVTITNCVITGGVEIADGQAKLNLFSNTIYYDDATPALTVTGTPDGTTQHFHKYQIGSNHDTNANRPNTFINMGAVDDYDDGGRAALAIAWPFTTYQSGGATKGDRLVAYANYWKIGDLTKNASFWDVRTTGSFGAVPGVAGRPARWDGYVKYANELVIAPKTVPAKPRGNYPAGRLLPPENFPWRIGADDAAARAAAGTDDRLLSEDLSLVLYRYSFDDNQTAPPIFLKMELFGAVLTRTAPTSWAFSGPQVIEFSDGAVHKDGSYNPVYPNPSAVVWSDGQYLYTTSTKPYLPLDITPKTMVAYAGTGTLSTQFPAASFEFKIKNLYYDPNATAGPDNPSDIDRRQPFLVFPASLYGNEQTSLIQGDPLGTQVSQGETPVTSNAVGGAYTATAVSQNDLLPYWSFQDSSVFGSCVVTFYGESIDYFAPNPIPAPLILRPTSGDLTVQPVVTALPAAPTAPVAAIAADAVYYDSTRGTDDATGLTLAATQVSLLNDNKEPTKANYDAMLTALAANAETKGKAYEHHYLSLLNTEDGNNVVTTASSKTIFMPYPHDYKVGTALALMYFNDYHRMPTDTITTNTILPDTAIIKGESGFTFTTTGDLGAYILAYESTTGGGGNTEEPDGGDTEEPGGGGTDKPGGNPEQPGGNPEQPGGNPEQPDGGNPEQPGDGDLPDTPGFIETPDQDGTVVPGDDGYYYFVDKDGVPLAYFNPELDKWVLIEDDETPLAPKEGPQTDDAGHLLLWASALLLSGGGLVYLLLDRRLYHGKRIKKDET